MKESTQDFIQGTLVILLIAGFLFMFFFGLGYIIYQTEAQDQEMYNTCISTCERVFQEQKLIDCIQTCNQMTVKNNTIRGGG